MSEAQAENENTTKKTPKKSKALALLGLLLLSLCLFLAYQAQRLSNEISYATESIKALTQKAEALQARVDIDSSTLARFEISLNKLHDDFSGNKTYWALRQTEQLALLARQRLLLTRDVPAALDALQAADQQLEQIDQPALYPLRELLANKIGTLRALQLPDTSGILLRLGALSGLIDELPLSLPTKLAELSDKPSSDEKDFIQEVWKDLLSLVRIRDNIPAGSPLLSPEQQYFLRENLRLQLLAARTALMYGEYTAMQDNLNLAQKWLNTYFADDAQIVQYAREELSQMAAIKFSAQLPGMDDLLEALQAQSNRLSK